MFYCTAYVEIVQDKNAFLENSVTNLHNTKLKVLTQMLL